MRKTEYFVLPTDGADSPKHDGHECPSTSGRGSGPVANGRNLGLRVLKTVVGLCTVFTVVYMAAMVQLHYHVQRPARQQQLLLPQQHSSSAAVDDGPAPQTTVQLLQRRQLERSNSIDENITPETAGDVFAREWKAYAEELERVSVDGQSLSHLMRPLLDYKFDLPPRQLQKAMVYTGPNYGMRRFMRKMLLGTEEPIKVALIGGSIAWGAAASKGNDFLSVVQRYLEQSFPKVSFQFRNGAVPATPSSFMNLCLELSMDEDVDLVMVEYVPNDGFDIRDSSKVRNYERLVRKLLRKQKMPAVVLVQLMTNGMGFDVDHPRKYPYYKTVEDTYGAVAQYYDLPWLSFRNAVWRYGELHKYGFNHSDFFGDHDSFHPLNKGHKIIADMVVFMMQNTVVDLFMHPYSEVDDDFFRDGMPVPIYPGNFEGLNRLCLHGAAIEDAVSSHEGWAMVNEGTEVKPKLGYVSNTVGAKLVFNINTTRIAQNSDAQPMNVLVAYLKSYVNMGVAEIRCESNCKCEPQKVQALHSIKQSTVFLTRLLPSQHDRCIMSVTVLNETLSDGHKFKVSGIMMNEYIGNDQMTSMGREQWVGQMQVINKDANDKAKDNH